MEPLHIEILRRYYRVLTTTMKVRELLPCLVSAELVRGPYHERAKIILDEEGQTAAAEYITIEVLLRNPDPNAFLDLLHSLEQANDGYLAGEMLKDLNYLQTQTRCKNVTNPALQHQSNDTSHNQGASSSQVPPPNPTTTDIGQCPQAAGVGMATTYKDIPLNPINFDTSGRFVPCVPLDRLHIGQRIARGGSGVIYQGHFNGTGVAVKEILLNIRRQRGKTVEELSREQVDDKEIKANVFVRHANVLLLMAYAIQDTSLYLAFELMDGENLEHIILYDDLRQSYSLTMTEKFNLLIQICRAVAYLHQCNPIVVHGDIKPANMMVTRNKSIAKLCDLGIAKLKSKNAMTTTCGYNTTGTSLYMAPELLLHQKPASVKSDVWSMAASLYEVFFEQPVWNVETNDFGAMKMTLQSKCKPELVEHPVPRAEGISKLIDKYMEYDDNCRQSSLDLLKDLQYQESLFGRNQRRDN